jgi:hypothetical protein
VCAWCGGLRPGIVIHLRSPVQYFAVNAPTIDVTITIAAMTVATRGEP